MGGQPGASIRDIAVAVTRHAVHGSVDEKRPSLFAHTTPRLPATATLVLDSGQGWRAGAMPSIHQKASAPLGVSIMTPTACIPWVNANVSRMAETSASP
jgi:hypothetical protein